MRKLIWKFDLLIYRLFYWRWLPRLKCDPDLAHLFAEYCRTWAEGNPPRNTDTVDQLLAAERERIRHDQPCLDKSHWTN